MIRPSCASCIFFDRFMSKGQPNRSGLCRRNPPFPVHTDDGLRGMWPAVLETHWCGEHAVIEEAIVETVRAETAGTALVGELLSVAVTMPKPEPAPVAAEAPAPDEGQPTVVTKSSPNPLPIQPERLPVAVRRLCDICTSYFNTDDPNQFCCDPCTSGRNRRGIGR